MYAQLTYFDGPRTPEQVAASDFAGRERIQPAVSDLGHRFRVYKLRRDEPGLPDPWLAADQDQPSGTAGRGNQRGAQLSQLRAPADDRHLHVQKYRRLRTSDTCWH